MKYKNVLDRMKTELDNHARDYENAAKPSASSASSRSKLVEAHQVHKDIADTTYYIQQDLAETEQIGNNVNSRLAQQREQIEYTQKNLEETEDSLVRSRKALIKIGRRVMTDKCVQAAIILVELLIIGLLVYFKFFKK